MRLFRHSDVKITQRHYTKFDHTDDVEAIDLFPRLAHVGVSPSGGSVEEANQKAIDAYKAASPDTAVRSASSQMASQPMTASQDTEAQVGYTSRVSSEVNRPAEALARIGPNSLIDNDLRAIGAVG